ncbi:MAG: hypothetical protein J0G28_05045 [Afipia sp.]|nr:hypothetical protein [Afipia sp.]OJW63549.1 MAG: hypothetical protein BGO65_14085 [Afipia sp. 64-13]
MLARFAFGILLAGSFCASAYAETLGPDEARKFVIGKLFSFNCFDGTRGAGRIYDDGSVAGSVQFSGKGQVRHVRLPTNTLQVRSGAVCASLRGMPFEPCFNLNKSDEISFRGSVSGLGFAYCDFRRQGNVRTLLTRAITRSRKPRSLHPPEMRSADASRVEQIRSEPALELRKSKTD